MAATLDLHVENIRNFNSTSGYAIQSLLPHLRRAGVEVRILDRPVMSGLAGCSLFHIDLTELPEAYRELGRRYERTINGGAHSIHRFLYSTLRLNAGDAHSGPVVVKTVLNSRGRPELRWRRSASAWTRTAYTLRKLLSPGFKSQMAPPYRVYRSIEDVPAAVWRDERLMVEKFAFDSLELPIVKHRYMFLLEAELNMRQIFDDVLCAPAKIVSNEPVGPAPAEVKAVRQRLKLDFGAIDYFIVEGRALVVDANKTVGSSAEWMKRNVFRQEFDSRMAEALVGFIKG